MTVRVFIDTNVFLYAHDSANDYKRQRAKNLILSTYKRGTSAISTQVLAEFFQNFVGKYGKPYADAVRELHFMSRCLVVEQTLSLLVAGTSIYNTYSVSFWDSMIIAAAKESESAVLYTEDMQHGQKIEGIEIVNPFV